MNTLNRKVFIVGLGRFGTLLAEILSQDFKVMVWSRSDKRDLMNKLGVEWADPERGIKECDTIFYAVPISKFEEVLKSQLKHYSPNKKKLIIDVLSVKVLAKKILEKHLPKNCEALLTHPIFGPDSVKLNGLAGLKLMMDGSLCSLENLNFWQEYFSNRKLEVIVMTAEEHDKLAAESQGLVFFMSRMLEDFGFKETKVDTYWVTKLQEIIYGSVTNDSWQLFVDLQTNNPYTKDMRLKLGKSFEKIYEKLLPTRIDSKKIVFGIQGGESSFNHEMLQSYLKDKKIDNYKIKFLYTSEKVLKALHRGEIDAGLFAIQNSVGGLVDESVKAMTKFKFKILEELELSIKHFLMKRKDVNVGQINKIMTHPQVLKQCQQTLKNEYGDLRLKSGEGDLIDPAKLAEALVKNKTDKNIFILGSRMMAETYDLEIVDRNLQDDLKNMTSFLLVGRFSSGFTL